MKNRWQVLGLLGGLVALGLLTFFLPRKGGRVQAPEEMAASVRVKLLRNALGKYRNSCGKLPPDLAKLGPPAEGVPTSCAAAGFVEGGALGPLRDYHVRYTPNAKEVLRLTPVRGAEARTGHVLDDKLDLQSKDVVDAEREPAS